MTRSAIMTQRLRQFVYPFLNQSKFIWYKPRWSAQKIEAKGANFLKNCVSANFMHIRHIRLFLWANEPIGSPDSIGQSDTMMNKLINWYIVWSQYIIQSIRLAHYRIHFFINLKTLKKALNPIWSTRSHYYISILKKEMKNRFFRINGESGLGIIQLSATNVYNSYVLFSIMSNEISK